MRQKLIIFSLLCDKLLFGYIKKNEMYLNYKLGMLKLNKMNNFEELLQGFEPTIKKLSRAYTIPNCEPDDIAQELRIQLLRKFDKFDNKRPFNNWAYIVCRKRIIDLSRKYKCNNRSGYISLDEYRETHEM